MGRSGPVTASVLQPGWALLETGRNPVRLRGPPSWSVKAADPWRLSLTRPKAASARSQCFRDVVVLCCSPHKPQLIGFPTALRLQAVFLRPLCTVSTVEKTCWRPTSAPSILRVPCESLHHHMSMELSYSSSVISCRFCLHSALQLASAPSRLSPPFPQIFSESLDAQGFLHSQQPPPGSKCHLSLRPLFDLMVL